VQAGCQVKENERLSRAGEIKGIVCLTLALFLLLCLVSYHPRDPSFTHFVADGGPVKNWIGSCGSHLADTLIRLFGISVFLIPLVLLVCAARSFTRDDFRIWPAPLAGLIGLFLTAAGLAAHLLADVSLYGEKLRPGGFVGHKLALLLGGYFNFTGTLLLLTAVFLVSLILASDFSVVAAGRRVPAAAARTAGGAGNMLRRAAAIVRRGSTGLDAEGPRSEEPRIEEIPRPAEARRKKAGPASFVAVPTGGAFTRPPLSLLDRPERKDGKVRKETLIANSRTLERKLSDFGVEAKVTEVKPGPVVTMYEVEPAPGVKITRITNLADDLALALRAPSVRIIAPLPGKAVIGIEIPNAEREPVFLRDVLDSETFLASRQRLPIALGEDIVGTPILADLIRMPHLLIAGTTGSGKSVALNAMICSLLFKAPPDEVKFLMIDPKRLELSAYEGIPHLLHPVVVNPKKASQVLKWAVVEMERRYRVISEVGARGIDGYNEFIGSGRSGGETATPEERPDGAAGAEGEPSDIEMFPDIVPPRDGEAREERPHVKLPYIVIVIDELADLMMVAPRDVEESLARLAQMSRAAGIHLMIATQRPSVDVITGVIKANFPTRISFQVSSKVDSRTILDVLGAEKLLGAGDMLFLPPGTSRLTRIHGAFVSDGEIERVVEFLKQQAKPAFDESIMDYQPAALESDRHEDDYDEKYDEAVELVTDLGQASISLVQRYLKIGYNRAARIIECMEAEGVVGPSDGVKPRKVLAKKIPR
jgi:DNA segregation ATPase FtsK/SpoIIIE, S-DNA-T family